MELIPDDHRKIDQVIQVLVEYTENWDGEERGPKYDALADELRRRLPEPVHPEFLIAFEINTIDYQMDREWASENIVEREQPDWTEYMIWHLVCPHCSAEDNIVEVDSDERWNEIGDEFDFSGGKMFAIADLGEHGDYEFSHWLCTSCLKHVSAPEFFQIEEYR